MQFLSSFKKLIYCVIIIFVSNNCNSQALFKIKVQLNRLESTSSGRSTGHILNDSNLIYKVPDFENSYISRLSLEGKEGQYFVSYLTGIDSTNVVYLIFDSNRNNSFLDEKIHKYLYSKNLSSDSLKKKISDLPSITIPIEYQGKLKNFEIIPIPKFLIPSIKLRSNNKFVDTTRFFFEQRALFKGSFKLGSILYDIEIKNRFPALSLGPKSVFRVYPSNTNLGHGNLIEYNFSDTVSVGLFRALIDSISPDGSLAYITFLQNEDHKGIVIGYFVPELILNDIDGVPFNIYQMNKPLILLDFWGTWCGPCIEGIPTLKSLYERYNNKLSIVSIAFDDNREVVRNFVDSAHMKWRQLYNSFMNPSIISKFKIESYPTFILLDNNKKIIYRGSGEKAIHEVSKLISSF